MDLLCRVEMLGRLRVMLPAGEIDRFRTQRAGWILAYLALRLGQSVPRERLIDAFWPDADLDVGRDSLNNAISSLRRQLEPPGVERGSVLVADRQQVRLNAATVETDVREFEEAVRRSSLDGVDRLALLGRAVGLYLGELLPGCYDEWAGVEQRRLHEAYLDAAERLADGLEGRGDLAEALAATARALAVDAFREPLHARKIRLHVALGQPDLAMRAYESLERLFEEELGEEPSPETRALVAGLPRTSAAKPPPAKAAPQAAPPAVLPPSQETRVSRLPRPVSRFFGREAELVALAEALVGDDARLVTLLGPGGAGKTRLSVEVARQLEAQFDGRVWWVGLADLSGPGLVGGAVARAMGLAPSGEADPVDAVLARLGDAPSLLVLDNLEHLIGEEATASEGGLDDLDEVARLALALLERAAGLRILATSRRPLRLDGEREVHLPPLELPEVSASPEAVLRSASASLYLDRARQARPDFAVNANNAEAVAHLCRLLEGAPLAIEMAAAWAKVVPPARMLERLSDRLDALTSRRRDLPARHQSLRATIEWSDNLLTDEQRGLLRRLSVFRGGWTLDAAEAAGGEDALELLLSLVEKSLVVAEEDRFRLLESVRQFAADRLAESGELTDAQSRHFRFFQAMAEASWPAIQGAGQTEALDGLERDHDNFRAALAWARSQGGEAEMDLAGRLRVFWDIRGHWREGAERLEASLPPPGEDPVSDVAARALIGAGVLASNRGEFARARGFYERSLALTRTLGNRRGEASVAMALGNAARDEGDLPTARRWYDASLEIARTLDDGWLTAALLTNLAELARYEGDLALSRRHSEEALAIRRRIDDQLGIAISLHNLALVHAGAGELSAAYAAVREGLALLRVGGERRVAVDALVALAGLESRQGRAAVAARLLGSAGRIMEEIGSRSLAEFDRLTGAARAALGGAAFERAFDEGRADGLEAALEFAVQTAEKAPLP